MPAGGLEWGRAITAMKTVSVLVLPGAPLLADGPQTLSEGDFA